jgi:hypothetical protein
MTQNKRFGMGLMKQQRSYVDVQSAPSKGTTVSLYFPRSATNTVESK